MWFGALESLEACAAEAGATHDARAAQVSLPSNVHVHYLCAYGLVQTLSVWRMGTCAPPGQHTTQIAMLALSAIYSSVGQPRKHTYAALLGSAHGDAVRTECWRLSAFYLPPEPRGGAGAPSGFVKHLVK